MNLPFIFLASQSARRQQLLKAAGLRFRVVKSSFQERHFVGKPRQTVLWNAKGKVRRARVKAKTGIILGADTIVYFEGKIVGKPKNHQHAIRMIWRYAGKPQWVYTGLALFNLESRKWATAVVKSKVIMKKYDENVVKKYVAKTNPLDKAGGYAVQERGDRLIEKVIGSYTNVVGLPVEKVKALLGKSFFPLTR